MKLFLKLIYEIYIILIYFGFKISPPNIILNAPKIKFNPEIIEDIHADTAFSTLEKKCILQAAKEWELFSNNKIKFNIIFDLNIIDYSLVKDKSTIIKVHSSAEIIKSMDKKIDSDTLGICYYTSDTTRAIYMVFDRLQNLNTFKCTMMHELGHYINLGHTDGHSIMNKHIKHNIYFPTHTDAIEYGNKWEFNPNECKYILF